MVCNLPAAEVVHGRALTRRARHPHASRRVDDRDGVAGSDSHRIFLRLSNERLRIGGEVVGWLEVGVDGERRSQLVRSGGLWLG